MILLKWNKKGIPVFLMCLSHADMQIVFDLSNLSAFQRHFYCFRHSSLCENVLSKDNKPLAEKRRLERGKREKGEREERERREREAWIFVNECRKTPSFQELDFFC